MYLFNVLHAQIRQGCVWCWELDTSDKPCAFRCGEFRCSAEFLLWRPFSTRNASRCVELICHASTSPTATHLYLTILKLSLRNPVRMKSRCHSWGPGRSSCSWHTAQNSGHERVGRSAGSSLEQRHSRHIWCRYQSYPLLCAAWSDEAFCSSAPCLSPMAQASNRRFGRIAWGSARFGPWSFGRPLCYQAGAMTFSLVCRWIQKWNAAAVRPRASKNDSWSDEIVGFSLQDWACIVLICFVLFGILFSNTPHIR